MLQVQGLIYELYVYTWMLGLVLGNLRVERRGWWVNQGMRFVQTKFTRDVWQ